MKFYDKDIGSVLMRYLRAYPCVLASLYLLTDYDVIQVMQERDRVLMVTQRDLRWIDDGRLSKIYNPSLLPSYESMPTFSPEDFGLFMNPVNFEGMHPRGTGPLYHAYMHTKTFVFGRMCVFGRKRMFVPMRAMLGSYNPTLYSRNQAYNHVIIEDDYSSLVAITKSILMTFLGGVPVSSDSDYEGVMENERSFKTSWRS